MTRDTIPNHLKPTPPVDDLNLDCALQKAGWICYDLRMEKLRKLHWDLKAVMYLNILPVIKIYIT